MNRDSIKQNKARQLRYTKPIVRYLNLESIKDSLWEIESDCQDVQWFCETDDDTLINALNGDEDEAYEFKMMFADLTAECEQMRSDLEEEYVPECFDKFFVACGAGDDYGGVFGFDTYEGDYMGITMYESQLAEDGSREALKRLTKEQLIDASRQCFRVYQSYIGLKYRFDCLKATMDILRDKNTGYLQLVKKIEDLYDKASGQEWHRNAAQYVEEFEAVTRNLPQEAWIQ